MFSPASASITPPVTRIPDLAVSKPTESTLVTSSYVNVPPIDTLPENTPSTAFTLPPTVKFDPLNVKFALSINLPLAPA